MSPFGVPWGRCEVASQATICLQHSRLITLGKGIFHAHAVAMAVLQALLFEQSRQKRHIGTFLQLERNGCCQRIQQAGLQSDFNGGRVGGGPYSLFAGSILDRACQGTFGLTVALRR